MAMTNLLLVCLAAATGGEDPAAWVEKRVREIEPSAEDRRFDRIGWARDVLSAERLSREHQRPVFLFTHDGRINTGRC